MIFRVVEYDPGLAVPPLTKCGFKALLKETTPVGMSYEEIKGALIDNVDIVVLRADDDRLKERMELK